MPSIANGSRICHRASQSTAQHGDIGNHFKIFCDLITSLLTLPNRIGYPSYIIKKEVWTNARLLCKVPDQKRDEEYQKHNNEE